MNSNGKTGAFVVVTTLFFAWGFITSNNDPLIAALRAIFSLGYTEALLTQFAFFLAYGIAALPAAALVARRGAVQSILIALAAMIAACLIMVAATRLETYAVVLVALFVMAGGITTLQVAANPLAAVLGAPERSHFRLTLAQAFNSLGVVLGVHFGSRIMLGGASFDGPAGHIADPAARTAALGTVAQAFLTIAAFILALMVFFWWSRRRIDGASPSGVAVAGGSVLGALGDRWAVRGGAAIFLYVGAEVAIGSIMINFLNGDRILGLPLAAAGSYLANFYWGGALVGRFIGSALLTRIAAPRLLAAAAAATTLLCTVVMLTDGPVAGWAALAVGLFNSVMFPTIFTITLERARASAAAVSGLLCTAIVGGAVLPLLAGTVADTLSLNAAFAVPLVAYVVIVAFAVAALPSARAAPSTGGR